MTNLQDISNVADMVNIRNYNIDLEYNIKSLIMFNYTSFIKILGIIITSVDI